MSHRDTYLRLAAEDEASAAQYSGWAVDDRERGRERSARFNDKQAASHRDRANVYRAFAEQE